MRTLISKGIAVIRLQRLLSLRTAIRNPCKQGRKTQSINDISASHFHNITRMAPNYPKTTEDHVPSYKISAEVFSKSNSLPSQAAHTACQRDRHQQETKWDSKRSKSGFFISQRQRREYISLQSLTSLSSHTPWPQTIVDLRMNSHLNHDPSS